MYVYIYIYIYTSYPLCSLATIRNRPCPVPKFEENEVVRQKIYYPGGLVCVYVLYIRLRFTLCSFAPVRDSPCPVPRYEENKVVNAETDRLGRLVWIYIYMYYIYIYVYTYIYIYKLSPLLPRNHSQPPMPCAQV